MNDQNKNQNHNQADHNAQLMLLGLIAVAAVLWKNEDKIRLWLYQNMMMLIMAGLGILALGSMYFWRRLKKKEAEYFERMRALRTVQTQQKENTYYKRREVKYERDLDR